MKRSIACVFFAFVLVGAVLLMSACGSSKTASDFERISKEKKIRVAIHDNNLPFEAGSGTEVDGFDPDLMKEIAKELGDIKIEWNRVPEFNKCFDVLKNKDLKNGADVVINAVSITEERKKEFDFSEPYFETGIRVAVKTGSPIQSFNDLKGGKRIAVEKDSTSEAYVKANLPDAQVKRVNSLDEAMNTDLSQDEIDAVVGDEGTLQYIINNAGDQFRMAGDRLTKEQYAIVFAKGSDLKAKIDPIIQKLKSNGKIDEFKMKWELVPKAAAPAPAEAVTPTTAPAEPAGK